MWIEASIAAEALHINNRVHLTKITNTYENFAVK
jgi:hypothetical protein